MNGLAITIAAAALNRTDAPRWLKAMATTAALAATATSIANLVNTIKKGNAR